MIHISDVKYILLAERVITKLPYYQSFASQPKLRLDPILIPDLKWEPTVTTKTNLHLKWIAVPVILATQLLS